MNLFSALSLRTKLLILLLTLPVVTLGTYLALATRLFKSDKIAYIFDSSSSVSNTLAAQIASEIQVFKMRAFPVLDGYQPEQKTFDKTAQGIFQKEAVFLNSTIYQIINADKQIRFESVASLEKPGIENPIAKWSQTDLDLLLTDARNHHMAIRSGIEKEGEWVAVALDKENSSYVSLNVFSAINFRSFFEKSHSYQTYLVDSNGHVLISPSSKNEGELSVVKNFSEWKFFRDLKGKTMPAGTTEALDPAGNSVLVSYSRVGSGNLMVVSIVDKEVALGAIKVLVTKSILFLVLLISVAALISVFSSRSLTAKLTELYEATKDVAEGNFNVSLKTGGQDEVGRLAQGFNRMASEVSRLMSETAAKARMEKELETAKTVQETLFPQNCKDYGSIRIAGYYLPASECGGDWWNYCEINGKIFLWIGDATGHGAAAALITSAAKSASAIIERIPDVTPGKALELLNKAVHETSKGRMLMTFFVASIDKITGECICASASHDPPLLIKRNGEEISKKDIVPLQGEKNPRLGENPDAVYKEFTLKLQSGDAILFYTDGLVEQNDEYGNVWGERRFLKAIVQTMSTNKEPKDAAGFIVDEAKSFRKDAELKDDITFFICSFDNYADSRKAA